MARFGNRARLARVRHLVELLGGGGWTAEPVDLDVELDELATLVEKRVEQPARHQLQLVRALDAIPQGVVVYDGSGEEVLRNRAARAFVDARHGEALVEAAVAELTRAALDGYGAGHRELELYGPPARAYSLRSLVIDVDGPGASASVASVRHGGVLVLIQDVSAQRRIDTIRRDFVANISHELRTPIGALGLLAETLREEDDAQVRDRLAARMMSEADRVSRTIDDLLELSRIEFGDDADLEAVRVTSLIDEARSRIHAAAEQRGVKVEVHSDDHLEIVADRRQLVSAVFNLLDNAVKYSPDASAVEIHAGGQGDEVVISVTDRGVGIPSRDLGRVFERFYRVDRARSRGTGGTGLGLAIVRHVVGNHGGSVSVESREGEGSTFTLRLPVAPVEMGQGDVDGAQAAGDQAAGDQAAGDQAPSVSTPGAERSVAPPPTEPAETLVAAPPPETSEDPGSPPG